MQPRPLPRIGYLRYGILLVLFVTTAVNYADRSTLSIAGPALASDFHLDAAELGYLLSAFGWAYTLAQLPGGWLLDRFGSRRVYLISLVAWAIATGLHSTVGLLGAGAAVVVLFILRFCVGLAEAPCFPANSRIVSAWFPTHERGTASAVFNAAQYFSVMLFSPILGWIVFRLGWHWVFACIAGAVLVLAAVGTRMLRSPKNHPALSREELAYIERGGGLATMDDHPTRSASQMRYLRPLLTNRMLVGIYLGQFGLNAVTYFFVTWFPIYLVKSHGMSILQAGFVAPIPAACGFIGGVLGGMFSDRLLRRGYSLTYSRKLPLVIGMLLSLSMIACNYIQTEWLVIAIMALAYFGKAFGALGWAIVADTAPKEAVGLTGGLFNCIGSIASITTPIFIGQIVKATGSFNGALLFVAANAALTIVCYLVVVGEIKRVELNGGQSLEPRAES
jgi:ACS family glucarate transporter-like MFS transporter